MFSHGAATLALDNSSGQNSNMLDNPLWRFSFGRRGSGPLAPERPAEADKERSPAPPLIVAAPPEPQLRRRVPAARLSFGLILYLISIGVVATTTIAVFFGVAFLLLLQPAGGTFRSAGSPNLVARIDALIHGLWVTSDSFQRPTADKSEPVVFSHPMAGSNAATASSIIPAVARRAAAEALPLRADDPAETDGVAPNSASPIVSETVSQTEATRSGRELLAVTSTGSASGDFCNLTRPSPHVSCRAGSSWPFRRRYRGPGGSRRCSPAHR